ncbi:lysosome membrane protein 2 [Patella vulgata]|uniref:lysosome membrane protein 2 n=1 Tax=Patella vulgata TaxID=6465 RepID=UPI00217F7C15|nr:lysosome membrane protein 2 [Patella vulgata]XP_050398544.1 lysosome membrane protein 2 [Patella vulgata]
MSIMQTRKKIIVGACIGLLLIILGVVLIPVVDSIVKSKVTEEVTLEEDGYLYGIWKDPPMPIYLDIYMFNLSNPLEVKNGAKPAVIEVGPYTYRERRIKFNITFNDNGTISYRQKRIFTFQRNRSVGDELDMFTTVNPPLLTLIEGLSNESAEFRKILTDIIGLMEGVFITRSLKDIVWGYVDPTLHLAHEIFPKWFYTDFIGYFMNKNNTDDGVYTIHSGKNDINKLGEIDKYNGTRSLNYWTSPWANQINGSDGTINPPFLEDTEILRFFSMDICRSGFGKYTSDVEIKRQLHLHRYTATAQELANKTLNPDNAGFCTKRSGCLGSGLLDVSVCTHVDGFPVPSVISFPHFYLADQKFIDGVNGVEPIPLKHETAIDVEPITGLVLQAAKRLQINMHITTVPDVKMTHGIKPTFLPVFWINERTIVDDSNADKLNTMLFTPMMVAHTIEIVLIAIGAFVFLLSLFLGCKLQHTKNFQSSVDEKTPLMNDKSFTTN